MELALDVLLLLSLVALVAGFIDAVAGGGGLLTIPALMLAGVPPVSALATNKLQACFGSFSATRFFVRAGLVSVRQQWPAILCAAVGAAIGAWAIQQINSDWLMTAMPIALMLIAVYLILAPQAGTEDQTPRMSKRAFNATVVSGVGLYDGAFGPGTGTFFTLGHTAARGLSLVNATAHAKLLNFTTNIVSLMVFIAGGHILWTVGLCMAVGQALGARIGAATAMKQGAGFIRWMTVAVCIAISVSLLFKEG
ncbi:hypothetical protein CHH28_02310 [Bacterioplanes sanyensis]|uniref:Probable membrane transporter protein n=1 Tax=Bacterioplanes sanyensis TaxID=1249553 RepID=A0A222FG61_9GAMM|nr:TSUP family transporter [Bacterioplanes sanyensis]ASP37576.1 hypothetical protein CHH28_02310 [Bacterioplanes sanyensis]